MEKPVNSVGLSLSLSIDRDLFARFESIKAHVSLINKGFKSIVIEDLTATNNPLFFIASNSLGNRFKGSLQSFWLRDDESMKFSPPEIEKSVTVLKPGESKEIDVDLINVFNDLPEGNYNVYASYRLCALSFLKSNIVSFRIVKSKPIYSITFQDYARNDMIPIRTSWINKGEDGFYIFLMANSQNQPSNIIYNHRILKINSFKDVYPSIPSTYGQEVNHILWIDDAIHILEILNCNLENIRVLNKSIGRILHPSLTTEDGELRFLTLLNEGSKFLIYLVRVPFRGEVEIRNVFRFEGVLGRHSVVFDSDWNPYIAYSLNDTIYCLKVYVDNGFNVKYMVLDRVKGSILNLHFSNAYMDEEGGNHIVLNYIAQENGKLYSYLIDVDSGKHIYHLYIPIEGENLKLIQVLLDYDCKPYFLFQDYSGALWFKPYNGGFIKATGEDERCPGNVSYPVMLISSKYSSNYEISLRYIKNESIFTYKRLKKLED
ncbi:MAG: hypothetical protein QXP91_12565 [Candidatus Methanomethylicia archaeon]